MAWITLTSEMCQSRITASEFSAVKSVSLPSGLTAAEMVAEIIEDITNTIRGNVAACARNTLGEVGTIPDELKEDALALFVYQFFTRVPNLKSLLDANRVAAKEDALKKLERVAACKFAIVQPTTPASDAEQAGGGNMDVIASRTRVANREGLSGLL